MFLQQPRRHKPNTGSRGLPAFLAANVGSPKCLEGYFLIAICNCYMPRNTHRTFTWKELDLLFSLRSKWRRTELVFTLPLYTCVPVDTHTHRAKAERDRQGCGLWDFCLQQQFCNYSKCFSNLYAHFFFCCFCCSSALPVHFVSRVDLTEWWLLWVCSVHKRFCFLDFFSLLKSIFFCANYLWCSQ